MVRKIQTDWPWLVRDYRATRRRQDGPEAATDIAAALSPAS